MNTQVVIKFPKHSSKVNLCDWEKGSYGLVFWFLQSLWADSFKLMSDISTEHDGDSVRTMGTVTSFLHMFVKGIHYGSAKHHQGKSSKYVYINGRGCWDPVSICGYTGAAKSWARTGWYGLCNCQTFPMRWRYTCLPMGSKVLSFNLKKTYKLIGLYRVADLGVDSWYADTLRDSEVVAVKNLTGNPIMCLLPAIWEIDYWITVAFDHVRFCLDYMIHLLMDWNCRTQLWRGEQWRQ